MKYLRCVGLVSCLLIVGVLGGLMAPLPSEALTVSIKGNDGVSHPVTLTTYPCETGYSICGYINPTTTARPIGDLMVADVSTSNRARVRIQDLGGSPTTQVDKMNLTGIILTPMVTLNKKTYHVIIEHTYSNGQGTGDYQWAMGVTGNFDPVGTDTVLNNQFLLTGTGRFVTGTDNDPAVTVGKLDKGAFLTPQTLGKNGDVSQTVTAHVVKTGCNTNSSGFCKPKISYDFQITIDGADSLNLTDSLIGAGIACTANQQDPLIPTAWIPAMNWIDHFAAPHYPLPTHVSELANWLGLENAKYIHDPKKLALLTNFERDLINKWLASHTCSGKITQVVAADAATGNPSNVTTCVDTNTCGTIVINKTIAQYFESDGEAGGIPPNTIVIPKGIYTFGFDGTGSGTYPFSINTDGQICDDECAPSGTGSYSINSLDSASTEPRIIRETTFPQAPDGDNDNDAYWFTKSVSCMPESGVGGTVYTTHPGVQSLQPVSNLDPTQQRSGYVEVTSLAANASLACTFENGIFEIEPN
jgi:hypothetical protein